MNDVRTTTPEAVPCTVQRAYHSVPQPTPRPSHRPRPPPSLRQRHVSEAGLVQPPGLRARIAPYGEIVSSILE